MQLEFHHHPAAPSPQQRPPLLFVHGAWHAAWCWDEHFVPYFTEAGFSVYTLSLRGHGASDGRSRLRWTSIAEYVRDVETTISRDLPQPPILIGHSMGGAVVQKYLERHRLPGAILLASVPPAGVLATTLRIARRHPRQFIQANLTMRLYPLISTPALAREAFFSADMPADQVLKYFGQLQDESYRAFLDMLALNLPRPRRVTTPVLVLGGERDTIFYPAEVHATARAYGTTATIFEQTAHDLMLEAGWRAVADTMAAWISAAKKESHMDAMTRITQAAHGLLFSSEADYALEPFVWTDTTPFAPDALYKLTTLSASTPVTKEDVNDFFAPMLARSSGDTPEARKRITRFRRLVKLLQQYLSDLAVYKLGEVEMPTFIVGRLADGTVAGLRTTVVET